VRAEAIEAGIFCWGYLTDECCKRSVAGPTDQWQIVEPNLTRSVKWAQAALMDRRTSDGKSFRQVRHHDWRGLMNTLEVETEIKNTVQATDAVEIIDCGRASERTQGVPFTLLFELGIPPQDKLLLY
jgi:hypothetical protein